MAGFNLNLNVRRRGGRVRVVRPCELNLATAGRPERRLARLRERLNWSCISDKRVTSFHVTTLTDWPSGFLMGNIDTR